MARRVTCSSRACSGYTYARQCLPCDLSHSRCSCHLSLARTQLAGNPEVAGGWARNAGTAVNPLLRAAYLSQVSSRNVTLVVPFLPHADQAKLFPNGQVRRAKAMHERERESERE